ncbi:hypothetical protein O181_018863 [Austropuccinia psidii MF-1]|uniref:Uncharacterized protein n=1 Tax=Austropuccinia psidii MF-1 TaxID=1389203 RepID=A0A9Q3C8L5_9BASI|nr:hypothetical protein [Austropuccinia psidii MF-1]
MSHFLRLSRQNLQERIPATTRISKRQGPPHMLARTPQGRREIPWISSDTADRQNHTTTITTRRPTIQWHSHADNALHPRTNSMLQLPQDRPPGLPVQRRPNMHQMWRKALTPDLQGPIL